jgi:hypothetical protein
VPSELAISQGADWTATVTLANADGTPADLAGYIAQAQLRRGYADETDIIEAELTCVIVSPDIILSLTHDETALLCGRYQWDLRLTAPNGVVDKPLGGKAVVTAEVTREAPVIAGVVVYGR